MLKKKRPMAVKRETRRRKARADTKKTKASAVSPRVDFFVGADPQLIGAVIPKEGRQYAQV